MEFKPRAEFVLGIADDEQKIHDSLRDIIEKNFPTIQVKHFFNTSSLKKHLRSGPCSISVLLLDVHFKEGDSGIDCLPILRQYSPGLPIMLLTAESSKNVLNSAFQYEIEYLPKPISENNFVITLESAIFRYKKKMDEIDEVLKLKEELKELDHLKTLQLTLEYSKFFESFLESRFNAKGNGLGEKLRSVMHKIPKGILQNLQRINHVRNNLVHTQGYVLNDIEEFTRLCRTTYCEIESVCV